MLNETALLALEFAGGVWLVAGLILAFLGGFDLINRVEAHKEPKSAVYWMSLVVLYPVILLQAAVLAAWEIMKGGTR